MDMDGNVILALVPFGFVYFDKTCIFCQGRPAEIHVLHFFAEPSFKQINYRHVYGCKDKVYT